MDGRSSCVHLRWAAAVRRKKVEGAVRPPDARAPWGDLHAPTTASAHTADSHSIRLNPKRLRYRRRPMFSAAISSGRAVWPDHAPVVASIT
jgi:hypothetical protein